MLVEGTDVSIFACGHLVWKALQAAEELAKRGINAEVINVHTIKPLDEEAVLASVGKTRCVVTCEEHNRYRRPGRCHRPGARACSCPHRRNTWR